MASPRVANTGGLATPLLVTVMGANLYTAINTNGNLVERCIQDFQDPAMHYTSRSSATPFPLARTARGPVVSCARHEQILRHALMRTHILISPSSIQLLRLNTGCLGASGWR